MFIYNVTVNVADDVHQQWIKWMKEKHIPDLMKTGCFIDSQMVKVLYVEDEGHTFSMQYNFLEMSDIEKYQKEWMNKTINPLQLTLEILSNIIIVLQQIHHLIVLIMTMTM